MRESIYHHVSLMATGENSQLHILMTRRCYEKGSKKVKKNIKQSKGKEKYLHKKLRGKDIFS